MPAIRTSVAFVSAALALLGCTTLQAPRGPFVRPYQSVRHGVSPQDMYRAGRALQDARHYEAAVEAYRMALDADSTFVDAHNALGVVQSLLGEPEAAEREFRTALELAPDAAYLHNNLGYLLLQAGRSQEALAALERARELEPGNAFVASNIAQAQARLAPAAAQAPAPATAPEEQPSVIAAPAPVAPISPLEKVADGVWVLHPAPAPVEPPAAQVAIEVYPRSAVAEAQAEMPLRGCRVEVTNGNGATGLARRTSVLLVPQGLEQPRLTNSKPFGRERSRIEYVAGAEQAAQRINDSLPVRLPLDAVAMLERHAKVRVFLGRDFPVTRPLAVADAGAASGE